MIKDAEWMEQVLSAAWKNQKAMIFELVDGEWFVETLREHISNFAARVEENGSLSFYGQPVILETARLDSGDVRLMRTTLAGVRIGEEMVPRLAFFHNIPDLLSRVEAE